jgi:hypothetical protein
MTTFLRRFFVRLTIVAGVLLAVAAPANAQKLITQAKVTSGAFTPGDAPGFPLTISVRGSYKLTGNLVVPANKTAIHITADNVTLDLNGFGIFGPDGNTGGIGIDAFQSNISVMNGSVRNMGVGINLGGNSHRVNNVYVMFATAGFGVLVGPASAVTNSTVNFNQFGIGAGAGSTVLGNTVHGNSALGLSLGSNGGFANNIFTGNNGGLGQTVGGVDLGHNACNGEPCP